jgi:glycosyltransferase involved in cell wall biosynthesis
MKEIIVLASVLKSVYDVRMYEKIAKSLPKDCQIHLIGSQTTNTNLQENNKQANLYFHGIANFHRLSWQRLLFGFAFLNLICRLKPTILLVNTFEILPFAIFYTHIYSKFLLQAKKIDKQPKLFYDVMENYFQNIAYQHTYPKGLRFVLAYSVRFFENMSKYFIHGFVLAEQCYAKELEFVQKNYVVLENKYKKNAEENENNDAQNKVYATNENAQNKVYATSMNYAQTNVYATSMNYAQTKVYATDTEVLRFVHTGTISPTYGTREAVEFVKNLHKSGIKVHLVLVGFCSDKAYFAALQAALLGYENLFSFCISTNKPVPHAEIIASFAGASAALLPYHINKSNENRIPTKFYEYIFHNIPIIIPNHAAWKEFCAAYNCCFVADFQGLTTENILQNFYIPFCKQVFYGQKFDIETLLWGKAEQGRLHKFLGLQNV